MPLNPNVVLNIRPVCHHKECAVFDLCSKSAGKQYAKPISPYVVDEVWYPDENCYGMGQLDKGTMMRGFCCLKFDSTGVLKVPALARIIELSGLFHGTLPDYEESEERADANVWQLIQHCGSKAARDNLHNNEMQRIFRVHEEVEAEVLAGGDFALAKLVRLVSPQYEPHMPRTDNDYPLP